MLYFPQLVTGSVAQYPLRRERSLRTVVNEVSDGRAVKFGDPDAETVEWRLHLAGLTDAELAAIEDLFQDCEGRLGTFTFLDPADNLLSWSEALTESIWQKGPLVELTESIQDPLGTDRATRIHNGNQTSQAVEQTLPVTASFTYAFSLYARSDQATTLTLNATAASAADSDSFPVTSSWRRCVLSTQLGSADEAVSFGVEIPSGASVDVFGLQVEAQPGASAYKRTATRGGVYTKARFTEDVLTVTTEGAEQNSLVVRIHSAPEDQS
jgi:hypothetical protein